MKSIPAKHAPQTSPGLLTRARQAMQTGRSNRSRPTPNAARQEWLRRNGASLIDIGPMIQRDGEHGKHASL